MGNLCVTLLLSFHLSIEQREQTYRYYTKRLETLNSYWVFDRYPQYPITGVIVEYCGNK